MLCYRDKTFCSARCATFDCPSKFTQDDRRKARVWWGDDSYPLATADLSARCKRFKPEPGGD